MKKLNPKAKAGCGVIFVFGLGFVAGLVATFVIIIGIVQKSENWKTPESKEFIACHVGKQMELDEDQMKQFQPIVNEILERRWDMRRDYIEQDQQMIEDEYFPRISAFLSEEQRKKGMEMVKRWRRQNASKLEEERPISEGELP
ncbi:hypothetical protein OAK43_01610 [Verrucomicrobiales bacterium]|nr:hypothetical protein [Verrucomicrobiales bacterium]